LFSAGEPVTALPEMELDIGESRISLEVMGMRPFASCLESISKLERLKLKAHNHCQFLRQNRSKWLGSRPKKKGFHASKSPASCRGAGMAVKGLVLLINQL
jgi:hypothetical protein